MTAQPIEQAAQPRYPEKTLADVVRVLTGDVDDDVREEFQAALATAGSAAKCCNCFDPLTELVEAWWPRAVFWTEPEGARRILADADDIMRNGLGDRPRHPASEVFAAWEERHGQKLNVKL